MRDGKIAVINNRDENGSPLTNQLVDACLRKLCQTYYEECPPPNVSPLPTQLDDISRACLLLADEWGMVFPTATLDALEDCRDKVVGRYWGRLESMPWRLSLELCHHDKDCESVIEELTTNFSHHNSSARLWTYDLAWIVRHRLNEVEASVRLLKNVADTLGYWDSALGLCSALFPTDEEFFSFADNFRPKAFPDQYQKRLDIVRQRGLAIFQKRFVQLDLRLHRVIGEFALNET